MNTNTYMMSENEDLPYCKCGCGERVARKGNVWIIGHNTKTEHPRGKCKICGEIKTFYAKELCKSCYMKKRYKKHHEEELLRCKLYRETHREECRILAEHSNKSKPGYGSSKTNKECSMYLGCTIAEEVLSHIFKNVIRMPHGNPGYDFIYDKGYKIDVKSSRRFSRGKRSDNWSFSIKRNTIADYFLCIAFDNRNDLNPEHLWLISGIDVNDKTGISIAESTIDKWSKYELDKLDDVISCCNIMKDNNDGNTTGHPHQRSSC